MSALTVADWCAFGLLIFGVIVGSVALFLRARYLIRMLGDLFLGLLVVANVIVMTWMLGQIILVRTGMVW